MLTATSHIFYKKIERRRNAAHTKNVQNVFMMLIVVYATFRKMSSLSQPFFIYSFFKIKQYNYFPYHASIILIIKSYVLEIKSFNSKKLAFSFALPKKNCFISEIL